MCVRLTYTYRQRTRGHDMTKNDKRELDTARQLVAHGMRDIAARTLATLHRSTRSNDARETAVELAYELGLQDRVTFVDSFGMYIMVHVDDAN